MLKHIVHLDRQTYGLRRFLRGIRGAAGILALYLFVCMAALPAYADDDEKPVPPSAAEVDAAGRYTIAILSLGTGFAVFYGIQRHRVMNSDKHPPEWDKKMGRSAILFAVISAIAVGGVTAALSRPQTNPAKTPPGAAPIPAKP